MPTPRPPHRAAAPVSEEAESRSMMIFLGVVGGVALLLLWLWLG